MRPSIRVDLTAGLLLDMVIADRSGSVNGLLQLLFGNRFEHGVLALVSTRCPDTCVAVRLQLNRHGCGILARIVVITQTKGVLQVLNMVAPLVGDNIHLGQGTGAAAELFKLVEEAGVQVDVLVARAVERASARRCVAAAGLDTVLEQAQAGFTVFNTSLLRQHGRPNGIEGVRHCSSATVCIFVDCAFNAAMLKGVAALFLLLLCLLARVSRATTKSTT